MGELEDFIEHVGVKGMKWGVRKKRSAKEQRVINKRKTALKKRRTLSDADVKKYIDRLNEEKRLKSLINEDLRPGRTATKRILSDSGQKVARTVLSGAGIVLVKVLVERKMSSGTKIKLDPKEIADTLARGSLKKK